MMKASIDLSAVADQLANCKPGDEYSLTFIVDTKTDTGLTGTASEIEHIGGGDYEEEEAPAPTPRGRTSGGKSVPKAIHLVSE